MISKANFCQNQVVLITGGTKGLGKAIALEFAHAGAIVYVTHKWGSIPPEKLIQEFEAEGVTPPFILESDASNREETYELMRKIKAHVDRIDTIISNATFSKIVNDIQDWKRQALEISIKYSSWSLVDLIQAHFDIMENYPRYLIGVSSNGPDICYPGYGLVGVSKSVLETLCRYFALALKEHGTRVNVIRPGFLDTESSRATFGEEVLQEIQKKAPGIFLDLRRVAKVCVALSSGLMDAVSGQTITIDEGWSVVSPIAYLTGSGLPGLFPDD
jgi:NAD(P)-dependent dehydrogenase (short-subunit alcohol dehydrogenase family)